MALNILLLCDVTKRRDMLVVWEQSQQVEVGMNASVQYRLTRLKLK
jgi:hypothetical protein